MEVLTSDEDILPPTPQASSKLKTDPCSSVDPLIEVKLNVCQKRSEITDEYIRSIKIRCTACYHDLGLHAPTKLKKHAHLGVLICKDCEEFYGSGDFPQDEDEVEKYCRWCANGGKLYGCDFCANSFCADCIRRNFGRGEFRNINDLSKWKCYCCDQTKLLPKKAFCDMIIEFSKRKSSNVAKKRLFHQSDENLDSSEMKNMLFSSLSNVENLSNKYYNRVKALKGMKTDHSVKRIHKTLQSLTQIHTRRLSGIMRDLSVTYKQHQDRKSEMANSSNLKNGNADESGILLDISISDTETSPKVHLTDMAASEVDLNHNENSSSSDVKLPVINSVDEEESKNDDADEPMDIPIHSIPVSADESDHNENVGSPFVVVHEEPENGTQLSDNDDKTGPLSHESLEDEIASDKKEHTALDNVDKKIESSTFLNADNSLEPENEDSLKINEEAKNKLLNLSFSDSDSEESSDLLNLNVGSFVSKTIEKSATVTDQSSLSAQKSKKQVTATDNSLEPENEDPLKLDEEAKNELLKLSFSDSDSEESSDKPNLNKESFISKTIEKSATVTDQSSLSAEKLKKQVTVTDQSSLSAEKSKKQVTVTDQSSLSAQKSKKQKTKKSVSSDSDDNGVISFASDSDVENKEPKERKVFRSKKSPIEVDVDDPKLKLEAYVHLERLNIDVSNLKLLAQEDDKLDKKDAESSSDELANLKKEVKSLSRSPCPKKFKKSSSAVKVKPKVKAKPEPVIEDDDSSSVIIELSSDEDEPVISKKNLETVDDPEMLAKADLMKSDDDDDDFSSLSDTLLDLAASEAAKNKKKMKPAPEEKSDAENSSSSDDFQPQKRFKRDKLLRQPIIFLDESSKEAGKENAKGTKKKHKKRKILSSDDENKSSESSVRTTSSEEDSSEEEKKRKTTTKKRKRIKKMSHSSSDSENAKKKDSDVEIIGSQDTPGSRHRKNIRRVISDKKQSQETKEAQQDEMDRRRRVQEKQKLYNKITSKTDDGKDVITSKMVLEVDPSSKEEIVEIHPDLVEKLKPHQVNGVKFMWECTIESLKQLAAKKGSGCILAHCMGLGKTLQVIAFLHTCLTNKYVNKTIKTAMVICPYNTVLNWASEFELWLEDVDEPIMLHEICGNKDNYARQDILKYWKKDGGVLIISYDMFRRLAEGKLAKMPKKVKQKIYDLLIDPGPDIVICDEGHILKNETSAISKATSKLRTQRRIVLTGTPLQNNLKEYHCMLQFVKPNLLGNAKEFRNRFVHPITNGQYDDSSQRDVKLMKKRVHILHSLLEGCVQRCDYSALRKFLPPKHEFVISVKLSDIQINMYRHYLEKVSQSKASGKIEGRMLFTDFNNLKNIWTFPYICEMSYRRAELKRVLNEDSEDSFIDDSDTASEHSGTSKSRSNSPKAGGSKSAENSSEEEVVKTYKTRSRAANNEGSDKISEDEPELPEKNQWFHEFLPENAKFCIETSGKMVLLMEILKECEAIGDKLIVFSQSLLTLDVIEEILFHVGEQPLSEEDKARDIKGTWIKGLDYFRMDGSTGADLRKQFIEHFNNHDNDRSRLFLISTRAGSLGTNLVGANRVVLLDTSWNPSHDVQAIFRVYRFGQIKPVYIYRLIAYGTMEEKIYDRQVTKLSLSIRVVDEQQIDRHFNQQELSELYNFTPECSITNRPTPMFPNDRLLAEMLIRSKEWIVTYHEHDSLLQNETEEDLTEEERKSAWAEYENEKEGLSHLMDNPVDLTGLNTEPDMTTNDYSGEVLPKIENTIKHIMAEIIKNYPADSNLEKKRKLKKSLQTLLTMYQSKHVKFLRMKQDYCAQGSVPQNINKYLGELESAMRALSSYVISLEKTLEEEERKEAILRMQQQYAQRVNFQQQQQQQQPFIFHQQMPSYARPQNVHQNPSFVFYNGKYYPKANFSNISQYNTQTYSRAQTPPVFNVHSRASNNNPPNAPLVTESEEADSTTNNVNTNKTSSVVITEIT